MHLANGTFIAELEEGSYEKMKDSDVLRNADSYAYVAMGNCARLESLKPLLTT